MGYSKEMNEQVYQVPQALMEKLEMGRKLKTLMRVKCFSNPFILF